MRIAGTFHALSIAVPKTYLTLGKGSVPVFFANFKWNFDFI
jgi:hypothetical protein